MLSLNIHNKGFVSVFKINITALSRLSIIEPPVVFVVQIISAIQKLIIQFQTNDFFFLPVNF